MEEEIVISTKKLKVVLLLVVCIVFVAVGIWLIINPPISSVRSNSLLRNPYVVGGLLIFFSGFAAVIFMKKLGRGVSGLIINNQGIVDNVSNIAPGLIPWQDIIEIKKRDTSYEKAIFIVVKNPADYISQIKNPVTKAMIETNSEVNGTPIGIPLMMLDTKLDVLYDTLVKYHQKHSA